MALFRDLVGSEYIATVPELARRRGRMLVVLDNAWLYKSSAPTSYSFQ
jgi:hypothetical protein